MRKIRYISLCSGVEAATLAFEPLGFSPVAYAEVDEFPSSVLAARFPDVPNLGDITKVDWKEYHGAADLVVAGFPCQSYSIAGLRKGLDDPRGQIMLESLAACRDIDPEWIILENVPGLLSADRGRAFETLLDAVAILWPRGGCSWRILDAKWYRVPQRRRRVFVVINTRDWRRAAEVLLDEHCLQGNPSESRQTWEALAEQARAGSPQAGRGVELDSMAVRTANTGANGCGISDEVAHTLDTTGPEAVAFAQNQRGEVRLIGGDGAEPVIMASGQAHAEIAEGVATTLSARQFKDPPILFEERVQATEKTSSRHSARQTATSSSSTTSPSVEGGSSSSRDGGGPDAEGVFCVADDNANAAVDLDVAGTLKVGGGMRS